MKSHENIAQEAAWMINNILIAYSTTDEDIEFIINKIFKTIGLLKAILRCDYNGKSCVSEFSLMKLQLLQLCSFQNVLDLIN